MYGYKFRYEEFLSNIQKLIEFFESCVDNIDKEIALQEFFESLPDNDSYNSYSDIVSFEYISDNFDNLYIQFSCAENDEYYLGIDVNRTVMNNPNKTWNDIRDSVNRFFVKFNKKTDIPINLDEIKRYYVSEVVYN